MEKLYINDNMLFKHKQPQDLCISFQIIKLLIKKHIYIIYIKFHQFKHYIHLNIPIYKKQEN